MIDVMPFLQLQNQIDLQNKQEEMGNNGNLPPSHETDGFNKSMSPLKLINGYQQLQAAANSASYLATTGQNQMPIIIGNKGAQPAAGIINQQSSHMVLYNQNSSN